MTEQQAAPRRRGTIGWGIATILSLASAAGAVPIYGGPASPQPLTVGQSTTVWPRIDGRSVNRADLMASTGNGVSIASLVTFAGYENIGGVQGAEIFADPRPVRWSASGTAALEMLGTDSNGYATGEAGAVNASGVAVGFSMKYGPTGSALGERAVRWAADGTAATELGTLGTTSAGVGQARAHLLNAVGTIGGVATKYDANGVANGQRAVRWTAGSNVATELALPAGTPAAAASVVVSTMNAGGTIAGTVATRYAQGAGQPTYSGHRAVRWDGGGTAVTLLDNPNDVSGSVQPNVFAINAAGTVVGNLQEALRYRAARWDAGGTTLTVLGGLDGPNALARYASARGVDATGATYGNSLKSSGGQMFGSRAVRWEAPREFWWGPTSTAAIELATLGTDANGYTSTTLLATNAAGLSVGRADKYADGTLVGDRAVLWTPDGAITELQSFLDASSGWVVLSTAVSINDQNWVTGRGWFDPDGAGGQAAYERLFVMQVPEPATLGVLGGVAVVALRRRRTV